MIEEKKKTTKQGIEYLRKIGVEKIKEDTHLDTIKITDILEKRFDKLDYVRAKGFIYILEKEYHLDLSDWLEEYHLAHPQMENEEQEKREHYSNEVRQKKMTFYLCMLGVCIAVGVVGQMVFWGGSAIFDQALNATRDKIENPDKKPDDGVKIEEPSLLQEEGNLREDEAKIESIPEIKSIYELGNPVFDDFAFDPENILYLEFSKPVWVGIVYLDSKKRTAKISKEFELSLDKELLIYVAYGSFVATLNEDKKKFTTYKPIFLIYTKEGGVRQIKKEEFIVLNGGIEW